MKLLIYCAGGLGKTLLDVAKNVNSLHRQHCGHDRWDEIAFVDDVTQETELRAARIYKYPDVLAFKENEAIECIIATGEPFDRYSIYKKLEADCIPLTNLIAPTVCLSDSLTLGQGIVITSGSIIGPTTVIKDNVLIDGQIFIGSDVSIGEHSVVSTHTYINEHVTLGKRVFVGAGALLNEGIEVKDDALISIGSVILHDVGQDKIVMGNPGKEIGINESHHVFCSISKKK